MNFNVVVEKFIFSTSRDFINPLKRTMMSEIGVKGEKNPQILH